MSEGIDLDFVCEWCGKDVMMLSNIEDDLFGITIHGKNSSEHIELCTSCFTTAYQALSFGKEVVQDCPINGSGRRIYLAVEKVGENNEIVNALIWPDHPLSDHAKSVEKNSVTIRASQA